MSSACLICLNVYFGQAAVTCSQSLSVILLFQESSSSIYKSKQIPPQAVVNYTSSSSIPSTYFWLTSLLMERPAFLQTRFLASRLTGVITAIWTRGAFYKVEIQAIVLPCGH